MRKASDDKKDFVRIRKAKEDITEGSKVQILIALMINQIYNSLINSWSFLMKLPFLVRPRLPAEQAQPLSA